MTMAHACNKRFCAIGAEGRTIISSVYPSFGFGGRNSVEH